MVGRDVWGIALGAMADMGPWVGFLSVGYNCLSRNQYEMPDGVNTVSAIGTKIVTGRREYGRVRHG